MAMELPEMRQGLVLASSAESGRARTVTCILSILSGSAELGGGFQKLIWVFAFGCSGFFSRLCVLWKWEKTTLLNYGNRLLEKYSLEINNKKLAQLLAHEKIFNVIGTRSGTQDFLTLPLLFYYIGFRVHLDPLSQFSQHSPNSPPFLTQFHTFLSL